MRWQRKKLPQFINPFVLAPLISAPFLSTHQQSLFLLHCIGAKNPSSSQVGVNFPMGFGSSPKSIVETDWMALVHGGAKLCLDKQHVTDNISLINIISKVILKTCSSILENTSKNIK